MDRVVRTIVRIDSMYAGVCLPGEQSSEQESSLGAGSWGAGSWGFSGEIMRDPSSCFSQQRVQAARAGRVHCYLRTRGGCLSAAAARCSAGTARTLRCTVLHRGGT